MNSRQSTPSSFGANSAASANSSHHALRDLNYEPDDLSVRVSELLVATADGADDLIDDSVQEVLSLLRDKMKMDVVFVSEFTDGRRVFRRVASTPGSDVIAAGNSDPLEESWCQRVVDGRLPEYIPDAKKLPASAALAKKLPFSIGTHISTPIVLKNGDVYGTLCCFSFNPHDEPNVTDLQRLKYTAQLTAGKIDRSRAAKPGTPAPALAEPLLQPLDKHPLAP